MSFYDDLEKMFGRRTANAITSAQAAGKIKKTENLHSDPHGVFEALSTVDTLEGFRSILRGPGVQFTNFYGEVGETEPLTILYRIPGLGRKSIAEIEAWATPEAIAQRRDDAAKKRRNAAQSKIDKLERSISRAETQIAGWKKELDSLSAV